MGQYDKYICTTLEKRHLLPGPTPEQRDRLAAQGKRIAMEHLHWIDEEVIPGAYYGETTWIWPPSYPNQVTWEELAKVGYATPGMFPHVHGFPELLSWWGTNPDDFADTDPMGMQMDDEIIPLESSWVAYIPANMPHMPVFRTGVRSQIYTRPTLHWVSGPGGVYTREKDDKTKKAESEKKAPPTARPVEPSESKYARYMVYGTDAGYRQARLHAPPGSGVHPPDGLHRPDGHPRRRVRVRHPVAPPRRHVQGRPGDHGRAHAAPRQLRSPASP